jgi:hypothetical protein
MSFQNLNVCHSFTLSANGSLVGLPGYECSEVTIFNHANPGNHLTVFDKPDLPTTTKLYGFCIDGGGSFTFRGITNSNQLSVIYDQAGSDREFSCRTQYFSHSVVRQ